MGSISSWINTNWCNPMLNYSSILPRWKVWRMMNSTWEKVIISFQLSLANPIHQRVSGLFRYLKLKRPMGFLLHYDCAWWHPASLGNVANFQFHEIASPKLAINGKVEESQFSGIFGHLQTNANSSDLFQFKGRFLTNQLAFVPWCELISLIFLVHDKLLTVV